MASAKIEDVSFVLPVELWDYILGKVTDTQDIWSCTNTCLLWNSLVQSLHKTPETWMFPSVLPSLFAYLPTNDILQCRFVCKQWSKSVDAYLTDRHCAQFGTQSYRTIHPNFRSVGKQHNLSYFEVLHRFEDDFSSHQGNPFLSRSLFLYYPRTSEKTLQFMEKFGSHLWSLSIHVSEYLQNEGGRHSVEYTQYLYKILKAVPNLRKLRIFAVTYMRRSDRENKRLRQFLLDNPPPPLPHLTSVHISVSHGPLLQQALEYAYSPQCTDICHSVVGLVSLSKMNLPKLKRLSLEVEPDNWVVQMANLSNLKNNPPQELHVNLRNFNSFSLATLTVLFEAVENLKKCLEHLKILFGNGYNDGIQFPENLNLPLLKTLVLSNVLIQRNTSFNFLKSMRSIANLKLEYSYCKKLPFGGKQFPELATCESTDFNLYLGKIFLSSQPKSQCTLYKSNVWKWSPSLEKVCLTVQADPDWSIAYSRQKYLCFCTN